MGFIRLLLIIIVFYYVWKLVSRYILLPLLQGYFVNTGNNKGNRQHRAKKEGGTTININSQKKKIINSDNGEYVDYEEIKN